MYYYTKFEDVTFSGDCRAFPAILWVMGMKQLTPYKYHGLPTFLSHRDMMLKYSDSFTSPILDVLIFPP